MHEIRCILRSCTQIVLYEGVEPLCISNVYVDHFYSSPFSKLLHIIPIDISLTMFQMLFETQNSLQAAVLTFDNLFDRSF